jgi:hypothetical protein
MVDNTDLIEAIDQVSHKFSQTLTLVDSIQNQSTEQVLLHHNRSTRPVRARRPTRLDTDVVVTATPKGRTVRLRLVPTPGLRLSKYQALMEDCQALPYGLKNVASEYVYRTPHLFMGPTERDHISDLYFLDIPRPSQGNAVNMVRVQEHREGSVHTLSEDGNSSTRSTCSVHTEAEHLDDDGYDLDPLPYPPGFPQIPRFPPRGGDMVLNISNDEPAVEGETDEQQQLCELRNAGRAEHRRQEAEEEERRRGPRPRDLANAFDRVSERQVFRTPSANVAVAMANLDRLPDQPEI